MTDNTNPGNFANRPKEEVQAIASKGGKASHGGGSSGGSTGSSGGSSDVSKTCFVVPCVQSIKIVQHNRILRFLLKDATLTEPFRRAARPPKKLVLRADIAPEVYQIS